MGHKSEVSHLQGAQTKALWQPRVMWAVGGEASEGGDMCIPMSDSC